MVPCNRVIQPCYVCDSRIQQDMTNQCFWFKFSILSMGTWITNLTMTCILDLLNHKSKMARYSSGFFRVTLGERLRSLHTTIDKQYEMMNYQIINPYHSGHCRNHWKQWQISGNECDFISVTPAQMLPIFTCMQSYTRRSISM